MEKKSAHNEHRIVQLEKIQKTFKILFIAKYIVVALLGLSTIAAASLFYVLIVNQNRTLPFQKILGTNIGFKTQGEVEALLKNNLTFSQSEFKLVTASKQYPFKPQDAGLEIDTNQTTSQLVSWAKGGSLMDKMESLYSVYLGNQPQSVVLKIDKTKLNSFLSKVGEESYIADTPPAIVFNNDTIEISEAREGSKLDKFSTAAALIESVAALSSQPIFAKFRTFGTTLNSQSRQEWVGKLEPIAKNGLTLTYEGNKIVVPKNQAIGLVSIKSDQKIPLIKLTLNDSELSLAGVSDSKNSANFNLNYEEVDKLMAKIKSQIDQDPIDARFSFDGTRVDAFTASRDGKELDVAKAKEDLVAGYQTGQSVIILSVKTTKAKVTNESVNNLGIRDLLGQGVSRFSGSGEGRVYNLDLGSQRLNGVLIPPGEIFSMYKAIGDVESTTGFKEAYVILNGRTQVGVGGGICQVSTTLFRAALNAGLPIVERHPHAYRVGYYEIGTSPGIDASVYFPSSDLKFKNDTPNYLLIQTAVNLRTSTLTYSVYGTRDGREVSQSTPTVSNVRPAPAPLYQDDPTLPVGVTKQVDFAAQGATTSFTRTVTKEGVVAQDTFTSVYRPWQAIYLRGTKTG